MFTTTNGALAARFTESSPSYAGDKSRGTSTESARTTARKEAEQSILSIANKSGQKLDDALTGILSNSGPALAAYVAGKMEVPKKDPLALAMQAILLRADDIATLAKGLDTTDDDALCELESAEQDAVDMNSAESMYILPDLENAAIKMSLQYALGKHQDAGGSGTSIGLSSDIRAASGINAFDFNIGSLLGSPTGGMIGSPSPGGGLWSPTEARITDIGERHNNANGDDWWGDVFGTSSSGNVAAPTTGPSITQQTMTGGSGSSTSTWDSIFNAIDKVVGAVTTIGGTVSNTTGAVNNAIQNVKNQASDIGADSITKAIKANMPLIIGIVVLILLTIIIVVYATRRK